ncbi:MAG: hypothetical protein R3B54_09520 [Bdellovibrionota bacterium]
MNRPRFFFVLISAAYLFCSCGVKTPPRPYVDVKREAEAKTQKRTPDAGGAEKESP